MFKTRQKYSYAALLFCTIFIVYSRFSKIYEKEISFDVLGYYMYLPATFVHGDPMLEDISWLKKKVEEDKLAGTVYMVSHNKEGEPMYFFLMGMSVFYLPWFLIGHGAAYLFDYPPDGFSLPYVYALICGAISYTVLGFWLVLKILRRFFTDELSALLLVLFLLGTNTVHHLIIKDLETVNILFMLCALVFYQTIKWHEDYKRKRLLWIAAGIALMTLVKPSEILIGILPVFYGVYNYESLKAKVLLLKSHIKDLCVAIGVGLIILFPQMLYWMVKTGRPVHDSYYNPGVGLDWWSPHTIEVLFSYKKGWLIYTPIMIFALLGFFFWRKKEIRSFSGSVVYFCVSFFVLSCWTEWWYGSSFSCRPVITMYPILIVGLGFFLSFIYQRQKKLLVVITPAILFFVFLNLFQWWQFRNYILHDYAMSKQYYWKTFLSTKVSAEDKKLRAFYRSPKARAGEFELSDYKQSRLERLEILDPIEINGQEYALKQSMCYRDITEKSHVYLKCRVEYEFLDSLEGKRPGITLFAQRKNGNYGWTFKELNPSGELEFTYLTPPIREAKDSIIISTWNPGKVSYAIKKLSVQSYEPLNDYE